MGKLFSSSTLRLQVQRYSDAHSKDHNLSSHGCVCRCHFQSITLKALCTALTRKSEIDDGRPDRMKGCSGRPAHALHYR